MHEQVGERVDLLLARAGVQVLAHRLVVGDVHGHARVGQEPLRIGDPIVDVVRPQPLVHPLELRCERLDAAGRRVVTDEVALHTVVGVGHDLERALEVAGLGSLLRLDYRLVEPRVVHIGILSSVDGREVVHHRRGLGRVPVEPRHPQHGRRPDGVGIEEEAMQPGGLHLPPLAHERRRQPAPRVVRFHVGIHFLLIGDHHREEQTGEVTAPARVAVARSNRILWHEEVLTADRPGLTIDERVMPEHERMVDLRLVVILLDGHTVLVDQLRTTRLRIEQRRADEPRPTAALTIGVERRGHLARCEVRREERVVGELRRVAERPRPVADVPAVHLQGMAATAVVLLGHDQSIQSGLLAWRGLMHVLRRRRLGDEAEHERHDRFPLRGVERELRHAIPLVVGLVLGLLVVVAPRHPQLLPEEPLPLVAEEFLDEVAGVGVERQQIDVSLVVLHTVGQFRRKRARVAAMGRGRMAGVSLRMMLPAIAGMGREMVHATRRRGMRIGPMMPVGAMIPVLRRELVHHELAGLLEGNPGGILAAPVGEGRAGRLAVFEPWNVVAGVAGKLRDRFLADVVEQHGVTVAALETDEHLLVTLDGRLIGRQSLGEHLAGAGGREPLLKVHERELIERLPLLGRERRGRRDVARPPVLGGGHEPLGGVGGRIAHAAVGVGDRLEQHVRHERLGVVLRRLPQPAVQPAATVRIRGELRPHSREIRAVGALRIREFIVLVAGEAATELDDLAAPLGVGRRRDALIGRDVVERHARRREVADHRADLERLVSHRLLEPLALEVLPEAEEPWHLRGRAEILWIPQPRIGPVEADLRGNMPQARPHLRERAGGFGILQERREYVRPFRQLRVVTGGRIPLDQVTQAVPGLTTVRPGSHLVDPPHGGRPERTEPRVGLQGRSHLVVVRRESHVGAHPLVGPRPAVDLVAAIAAVAANEVVALDELVGRRLGIPLTRLEIDDLMMALQAARLLEPLGLHRKDPMVVVEPAMFDVPLLRLLGRVG